MPLPRMVAPALAGLLAGWTTQTLPFYPGPAFVVATALATALTAWAPRLGLAFVLALPILPLGQDPAVIVQLVGESACWEARYGASSRNDDGKTGGVHASG